MFKKLNKKGFTLAELLIVVAIIAVLVAISIPIFNSRLEASRESVDASNLRAAYAVASADLLTEGYKDATKYTTNVGYYNVSTGDVQKGKPEKACGKSQIAGFQGSTPDLPAGVTWTDGAAATGKFIKVTITPAAAGTNGSVTIEWEAE
ncbi:type II secretion system protein [Oribacterium sp. P9]|uniref:type II secretion system protein n=1 Tax=Oribacterium sp. P9 TaxID=3378068 RepID=UPI003966F94F